IETEYILEVNATRHCNFRCHHCNHVSAFASAYFMEPSVLAHDLLPLSNVLRVRQFIVQGGEPLLHPKVGDLLRIAYASGIGAQTAILTNGKLLPMTKDCFWEALA